jgi:hypothetical protein
LTWDWSVGGGRTAGRSSEKRDDPVSLVVPPGLIPVPLKGAILLLTEAEFTAGVRRGKWFRRRQADARRTEGEMLKVTKPERAKGAADGSPGPGRGKKNAVTEGNHVSSSPTLADLGIGKKESHEAQKLADLLTQQPPGAPNPCRQPPESPPSRQTAAGRLLALVGSTWEPTRDPARSVMPPARSPADHLLSDLPGGLATVAADTDPAR